MTNVNKKTAGKNKDSEKTTESKSPVTVKQMPDGTFEFSGGRGGFNIVAQKNKALEPYGKCIWNYAWCWNWFLEKNSLLSISRLETQDLYIITICMSVRNITIYIKKHSQSASIRKITSRN